MPFSFDPQEGLIVVRAELVGPTGTVLLRLALDTGATWTLINVGALVSIGYDPALRPERVQVTTGSGIEFVPRLNLSTISALGQHRADFPVLCHTLPPSAAVDGLLGVDFFRGQVLTIDFRKGSITLA
jgi:predicted aspartyl protease